MSYLYSQKVERHDKQRCTPHFQIRFAATDCIGIAQRTIGVHLPVWAFKPAGGIKSVTHSQCDARPTVTFLALEHHRCSTSTKLYCLVTKAGACKRAIIDRAGGETRSRDLSITSPNTTTRLSSVKPIAINVQLC